MWFMQVSFCFDENCKNKNYAYLKTLECFRKVSDKFIKSENSSDVYVDFGLKRDTF